MPSADGVTVEIDDREIQTQHHRPLRQGGWHAEEDLPPDPGGLSAVFPTPVGMNRDGAVPDSNRIMTTEDGPRPSTFPIGNNRPWERV